MPLKLEATLGIEFCFKENTSALAAMSKKRCAVVSRAERVAASISDADRQLCAWAASVSKRRRARQHALVPRRSHRTSSPIANPELIFEVIRHHLPEILPHRTT